MVTSPQLPKNLRESVASWEEAGLGRMGIESLLPTCRSSLSYPRVCMRSGTQLNTALVGNTEAVFPSIHAIFIYSVIYF